MSERKVTSVAEWLALPEIGVPAISVASETGSVFTVYKVGFLYVDVADCDAAKVDAPSIGPGKCALPTITADCANERTLCRLPLELADWAFSCVALAQQGIRPFPAKVEFGCLDGRMYAETI
ncbi:hypothetical protein PWR63_00785 [Paraburkholderia sp. A2WS-5]|uniref:hypothetical protein n=1 Tax=unclassified Paraburkholderia TaxID=2615204 RepID=UPI003B7B26C8